MRSQQKGQHCYHGKREAQELDFGFRARLDNKQQAAGVHVLRNRRSIKGTLHANRRDKLKCTWLANASVRAFPMQRARKDREAKVSCLYAPFAARIPSHWLTESSKRGVVRTQEEGQMCEGNSRYATLPINTIPAQVIHLNCVRKNQMAVSLLQQRESWPTSGLACGCLNQVMVKLKVHSGK